MAFGFLESRKVTAITKVIISNDMKQAIRPLLKRPWHSFTIVLILAIGIGMGSAFYSVGEGLLLRPLPFDPKGRLMDVEQVLQPSGNRLKTSQGNMDELGDESKTLDGVAVYQMAFGALTANGETAYAEGMKVDSRFFPLLGVSPAIGRVFATEDEQYGAPGTIILSYAYWQRRFASNRSVLGKSVSLNKRPYVIIGVMPELFYFPFMDITEEDFWTPLQNTPAARAGNYDKYGIARIKVETTLQQAQAEMIQISAEVRKAYPQRDFVFRLRNYQEVITEGMRPLVLILSGIMICVQLVVCINVASLLLVEAVRNRKEVEIRFALGGTRWKIARLFMLRAATLAFAGGVAGSGLAYGLVFMIREILPAGFPGTSQITLNISLLWLTMIVSIATGIVFGFWPALAATTKLHKVSLHQAGQNPRHSIGGRSMYRSRRTLVALQLMFSSAFLVMTTLLGISFYQLLNADLGMRLDHRLLVSVAAADSTLRDDGRKQFYFGIQQQLQTIPGVEDVGMSSDAPLTAHGTREFRMNDVPALKDSRDWTAIVETVGTGYFRVLGIPMRQGRSFIQGDTEEAEPVAIVNEAFAKRFFGVASPIGKQICIPTGDCPWREIVGIASDARESRIDSPAEPTLYVPFWQAQPGFVSETNFILRTRVAPAALAKAIHTKMSALGGTATTAGPITLEEMRSRQLMGSRYCVWFLASIAFLALALSALGVYGIIAGDVGQRRREIGIRAALGASPKNIAAMFRRQMLSMLIPALAGGLGLSFLLVRYTTSILYGVAPVNTLAYSVAALVVAIVATISTALPVRQALTVSPSEVLREE